MKLYATTTSERASKGQGGNEWIEMKISNDNQEQIAHFSLKINAEGTPQLKVYYKIGKIKWIGAEPWEVFTEEMERGREKGNKQQKARISSPSRPDWMDNGEDDTY